jgi:asparagine synthase (glutamine-hydrolysing)
MCGIAGYIGRTPLPERRIEETLARMRRRGPDAVSSRHQVRADGQHVHLLHSRLKIVDLDARANQPFLRDGLDLVFNGEIYNYVELKADLTKRGHAFVTTSDTEVLAAALREWPLDQALDRFEGMWAFACYDERNGTLVLSRDRFGEKPLYIYEDGSGLYFASEVKFLRELLGASLEVNVEQVRRYLVNGYKSLHKTSATFFRGVRELPASTSLVLGPHGRRTESRYWTPRFDQDETMTFEDARVATRDAVLNAVSIRLRADVPLAFCMSGGIDSNVLISVAKKVFGYDVHGFTIDNTDERYEETAVVRHAVSTQDLRHTLVPPRAPDGLAGLRELVRHHDAPIYTITYFVHWLLIRAMHEHDYRIAVSGTGGDELFTGYYDHHLAYLAAARGTAEAHSHEAGWRRHVQPLVRNPYLSDANYFIDDPSRREHIYFDRGPLGDFLTEPFDEPFVETSYTPDLLRNRMANELFTEAVPIILHEDDLNSMYYSVENRSPFLDRRLFELTTKIPTRLLMRDGLGKVVLREAMRGVVPDRILDNRRKVGFNAPLGDVVDLTSPEIRRELLSPSPIFQIVRKAAIEQLLDTAGQLPNSRSKFLFNFICARLFMSEFSS